MADLRQALHALVEHPPVAPVSAEVVAMTVATAFDIDKVFSCCHGGAVSRNGKCFRCNFVFYSEPLIDAIGGVPIEECGQYYD